MLQSDMRVFAASGAKAGDEWAVGGGSKSIGRQLGGPKTSTSESHCIVRIGTRAVVNLPQR
jgi:hypothetical protein